MNPISEKIKPNILTKTICILMATVFFALSLWCLSTMGKGGLAFGKDYLHSGTRKMAFTESFAFENTLLNDLNRIAQLASKDEKNKDVKSFEHGLKRNDATFKYYVESVDGTVFTNLKSKPSDKDLKSHRVFLLKDDKTVVTQGSSALKHASKFPKGATVRIYMADALFSDAAMKSETVSVMGMTYEKDEYIAAKAIFQKMQNKPFAMMLALTIVSFLVSLALLIEFLFLVGRVETEDGEEKKIAFIDRVPAEIHTLISLSLFAEAAFLGYQGLSTSVVDAAGFELSSPAVIGSGVAGFLVLAEYLASVCRSVKSGYGFWKHTIMGRMCLGVAHEGKYIGENGKAAFENIKKDPKQLGVGTIILTLQYLAVNFLFLLGIIQFNISPGGILFLLGMVLFNVFVIARFIKRFRGTDEPISVEE